MALDDNGVPVRRGKPLQFSFDFDVVELLYTLAPTKKGVGRYLSELVRRDHALRRQWERVQTGQPPDVVDVQGLE